MSAIDPTIDPRLQRVRELLAQRQGTGTYYPPQSIDTGPAQAEPPLPQFTPPPQPDVTPPAQLAQSPYLQAAQVQEQAMAPPPDPFQGMSPGKRMVAQLLQGAAQGAIHAQEPGGYPAYQERQQALQYRKQQDLLNRARELHGEGMAQSQLHQQDVNAQLQREQQQRQFEANLQETQRLRATQEEAQQRLANQPIAVPSGAALIDPKTHQPIFTNPRSLSATEKGLQHVPGTINGQNAWAVFNPNPDPGEGRFTDPATGKDISTIFKPVPPPVQFLPGPTGEIAAVGSTRTGQITPIQNPVGARRAPVPAGMLNTQRELENSARKLTDLRAAFKPEFVGPVEGRVLKVKSKLPGTTMPAGWGTFTALQADLKNSVIKLITGAQMGQQEADRILQQVPTETDKPEIWLDKFNQTQKNVDYLNQVISQQTGIGGVAPTNPNTVQVEKWERGPDGLPRKVTK